MADCPYGMVKLSTGVVIRAAQSQEQQHKEFLAKKRQVLIDQEFLKKTWGGLGRPKYKSPQEAEEALKKEDIGWFGYRWYMEENSNWLEKLAKIQTACSCSSEIWLDINTVTDLGLTRG